MIKEKNCNINNFKEYKNIFINSKEDPETKNEFTIINEKDKIIIRKGIKLQTLIIIKLLVLLDLFPINKLFMLQCHSF